MLDETLHQRFLDPIHRQIALGAELLQVRHRLVVEVVVQLRICKLREGFREGFREFGVWRI